MALPLVVNRKRVHEVLLIVVNSFRVLEKVLANQS